MSLCASIRVTPAASDSTATEPSAPPSGTPTPGDRLPRMEYRLTPDRRRILVVVDERCPDGKNPT